MVTLIMIIVLLPVFLPLILYGLAYIGCWLFVIALAIWACIKLFEYFLRKE